MRAVLYVAHALRPTDEEIAAQVHNVDSNAHGAALSANLDRAMTWLSWLRRSFPETTFIAPWIASVLAGKNDTDSAQREAGLVDDCAVIERCDGIVLCGPRISDGMRRETEHGCARQMTEWMPNYFEVYDLTKRLIAPPHPDAPGGAHNLPFATWAERLLG